MVTMRGIKFADQFIEAIFEGRTLRGFPNLEEYGRTILLACLQHRCTRVLINCFEVEYDLRSDIFAEHELAMSLSQGAARTIQWAILLPKSTGDEAVQVVNAMRNPGVRFMAFLDRAEAIAWLEAPESPAGT
jgi:hypothetical protein